MSSKEFSSDHYNADDNAKNQVGKWLATRWGFKNVRVNPDKYGIDLLAEHEGRSFGIEVEVKHNWKGRNFPFSSLHYAARKIKFLEAAEIVYFVTVNDERTHLLVVSSEDLNSLKLVKKDTHYTSQEWFIEVPIDKTYVYEL
jgi:hypothetical protein